MLEKIINIRAIGRFTDCTGQGDTLFRRLTLIYGENGRGKTTLCDILRSLANGDADLIKGRATLGTPDKPLVQLRAGGAGYSFKDGAWSSQYPDLCIFDKTFVHNNVYAGDLIEHEHKRNLYQVIVGEQGTQLARRIEKLDSDIRQLNKDISATKTAIEAVCPKHISIDAFVPLAELANADSQIKAKETELSALSRSAEISRRGILQSITLPSLPMGLVPLLSKTLDELSKEAEEMVRKHVDQHLGNGGEQWIAQGMGFDHDGTCPYCGQLTKDVPLLSAFKAFFGDGYKRLKADVNTTRQDIDHILGESAVVGIQRTITSNATLVEFWKQFADVSDAVALTFEEVEPVIRNLRDEALKATDAKTAAILEPISSDTLRESKSGLLKLTPLMSSYNAFVSAVNTRIAEQKRVTGTGNLQATTNDLATLKAQQKRHESPTKENCQRYSEQVTQKKSLEAEKDTAKKELDQFGSTVCVEYERRINELLERFHAGFRICDTTRRYV